MIEIGVGILLMCLFVYCCFFFGSCDEVVCEWVWEIMSKVICLVCDFGICIIQLVGYDVYYEDYDEGIW